MNGLFEPQLIVTDPPENPDNLYEGEEYAIMDTSLEGRWLDVRLADKEYPFVCKQYTTTCPSIREYYQGKLEPLNKVRGLCFLSFSVIRPTSIPGEVHTTYLEKLDAENYQVIAFGR